MTNVRRMLEESMSDEPSFADIPIVTDERVPPGWIVLSPTESDELVVFVRHSGRGPMSGPRHRQHRRIYVPTRKLAGGGRSCYAKCECGWVSIWPRSQREAADAFAAHKRAEGSNG